MSSTDESSAALARFWQEVMLPAARALGDRRERLLPPGPDRSAASYFRPRPAGPYVTALDEDQLDSALADRWTAEGLPELAALAAPLLQLGRELRETEDESAELSPFIYAMF